MSHRLFRSALLSLLLVLVGASARAQSTGGSFGSSFEEHEHESTGESTHHSSGGGGTHSYEGTHSFGGSSSESERARARRRSSVPSGGGWDDSHGSSHRHNGGSYDGAAWTPSFQIPWTGIGGVVIFLILPGGLVLYLLLMILDSRSEAKRWREDKWKGGANFNPADPPKRSAEKRPKKEQPSPGRNAGGVAMTRISLGFAPTARREIQAALKRASKRPMRGNEGRVLSEMLALFQRNLAHVAYAHAWASVRTETETRNAMRSLGMDLRARYRADTEGPNQVKAPALRARAEEGEGLVVVTLVCMRSPANPSAPPHTVFPLARRADVAAWLSAFVADRTTVQALDVIWSPSEENDRLSSYELEAIYSELVRLEEASAFGSVTCPACRGAHPRELVTCPHCGRPVDAPS